MTKSYRYNNNKNNPLSDYGHAMFADDQYAVEGYGHICWTVDHKHLVDFDGIVELIEAAVEKGIEEENEIVMEYLEYGSEVDFVYAFNPENIVDSANAWDNGDLVQWIWDTVLEPNDIYGIKTYDGAIVFDPDMIELVKQIVSKSH